jgi:hypothetical protein
MKNVFLTLISLMLSSHSYAQANGYITREKIQSEGNFNAIIPSSDLSFSCREDEFWGESDLTIDWKMPKGLTTKYFQSFSQHNYGPGACDYQTTELNQVIKKNGGLSVQVAYKTKLAVIIWSDECALIRLEDVSVKPQELSYHFGVGGNTLLSKMTPQECLKLSESWAEAPR